MSEIYKIILVALAAAFVILVSTKNGSRERVRDICDLKKAHIIANMLDCDLCFSFWVSVAICIMQTLVSGDTSWLIVPIFSTPITRFLL